MILRISWITNAFKMNEMKIYRKQNRTKRIKIIGRNLKNKKNRDCTCVRPNGWYNDDLVSWANRYFFAIHTHNLFICFLFFFSGLCSLLCVCVFLFCSRHSIDVPYCGFTGLGECVFFRLKYLKKLLSLFDTKMMSIGFWKINQHTDNRTRHIKCQI